MANITETALPKPAGELMGQVSHQHRGRLPFGDERIQGRLYGGDPNAEADFRQS